ncbi:RNA-directed DNA polymerase, eukaryota [Tanacetum coccineum]
MDNIGKAYWVRAKEISGWIPDFDEQNDEESDSDDEQFEGVFKEDIGGSVEEVQGENEASVVPDTVVEEANHKSLDGDDSSDQNGKQSADPFNIYSLLNKNKLKENKESSTKESLKYPLGFTPREDVEGNVQMDNQWKSFDCENGNERNVSDEVNSSPRYNRSKKEGMEFVGSGHFKKSEVPRTGGSLLTVMDELIKVGQTMGYNIEGCLNPKAKKDWVKELCVSNKVNFLTLQETKMESIELFDIKRCWGNFAFDFVHSDSVVTNGKLLLIISVYAPQEFSEKKLLWDYLGHVIANWKGEVIIMGDFNEVCNKNERFGSIFNVQGASASKMSKLDRFLMSESLLRECPNFSAITLDRYLSDHRPILLRESTHDYGPIPFWFFHYWLEVEGFENFVNEVWHETPVDSSNAVINLMNKLKYLKKKIRVWNGMRHSSKNRKHVLKQELADLEMVIDKGDASATQKAKIKWAIEGDENSNYYHGILNKKRNRLSIRGVLVDGNWVESPDVVKNEFLTHFKKRFERPQKVRPILNMVFPHQLNSMQQLDLEAEVSNEEIKKAVWDCGIDKSSGPDGFTFGFYRRFWGLIEQEVVAAVKYFFQYGRIPKGCNSSFIALIPKILDAKMVKDFRPISLIGSLYKIIAKILANRLVMVLGDIVNEVQSAFVVDRQILDGPFILNEIFQWSILTVVSIADANDKCFQRASGLSINLSKSKLMGIAVSEERVEQAANRIGCVVLKIVDKMAARLSKWKMKTLSIGGRLTLLKAVLGSMPIYHMSIFKVPMKVLQRMESIRFHFFSGVELNSKKSIWVKWSNVLSSKEKGGLGVSSLYALNRALMFKWVWRFTTQKYSLWARVIKAIYGEDGKIGSGSKVGYKSIWRVIVQEMEVFKAQGIDLYSFMQKKLGNGADTFFWDDVWRGDMALKQRYPRLYALELNKKIDAASKLTHESLISSFRRVPRSGVEQSQLIDLMAYIEGVVLGVSPDRWSWALEGSGEF